MNKLEQYKLEDEQAMKSNRKVLPVELLPDNTQDRPKRKLSHAGSRNKGAVGEREIKDTFIRVMLWVEAGFDLKGNEPASELVKRNSTQSDRGGHDLLGVPMLSVEIKRQEAVSLGSWWEQCQAQAKKLGGLPVLIWRQNNRPWRARTWGALWNKGAVIEWAVMDMELDAFMSFYEKWYRDMLFEQGYERK